MLSATSVVTAVVPVAHVPFNIVKSHLLLGERVVVVDAGPPGGERRILRTLEAGGRVADDVSLIVVSHTHTDHAGGAAALAAATGAPIALHRSELAYARGEACCPRTPTGWPGRLFGLTPPPRRPFTPFEPDVLVGAHLDLREHGVEADVLHVGGHTPGSLAVHVPSSGELLAVDLLAGGVLIGGLARHGRVIDPPFHEDRGKVVAAVRALLGRGSLTAVHVCHGGPLHPDSVSAWAGRQAPDLPDRIGFAGSDRGGQRLNLDPPICPGGAPV